MRIASLKLLMKESTPRAVVTPTAKDDDDESRCGITFPGEVTK